MSEFRRDTTTELNRTGTAIVSMDSTLKMQNTAIASNVSATNGVLGLLEGHANISKCPI